MDPLLTALTEIMQPTRLLMLATGTIAGLVIGVIPGLGGIFGMALLVPLTYTLDPYAAIALLLGMGASTTISDTVSAVLLGIPGTAGAMPTVLDGHAMAKQGEAARALGAAYASGLVGGLVGAVLLALSIPLLGPLVLALRTPDFLAVGLLGLGAVAFLTGSKPAAGVIAACLGVLCSMIGIDDQTASQRWTFGLIYLWDGLPLAVVFLGLFGLPELASLLARGRVAETAQSTRNLRAGMLTGMRDTLQNLPLVTRSAAVGAGLGAVPGWGLSVVGWVAYGLGARKRGHGPPFGEGNVRGVIAPESAANATEGGTLIPTIALGLPGSASMTIILSALILQGLTPGPRMLTEDVSIAMTMVLAIALANVLGTAICLGVTPMLARIAQAPAAALVPVALCFVTFGAFRTSGSVEDLVVLVFFGLVGFVFRSVGWSRPAFALGFVLGPFLERYFFVAHQIHGNALVLRPSMLIVMAILALALGVRLMRHHAIGGTRTGERRGVAFAALAAGLVLVALSIRLPSEAGIFPLIAATGVVIGAVPLLWQTLATGHARTETDAPPVAAMTEVLIYVGLLTLGLFITGPASGAALVVLSAMRFRGGMSLRHASLTATLTGSALYGLFTLLIHTPWPRSVLGLP